MYEDENKENDVTSNFTKTYQFTLQKGITKITMQGSVIFINKSFYMNKSTNTKSVSFCLSVRPSVCLFHFSFPHFFSTHKDQLNSHIYEDHCGNNNFLGVRGP